MAEATKTTKADEELEAKASLPVNHPQAGYVSPDLSEIVDREPPDEERRTKRPTREENIERREEEVKAVAESEDKAAEEIRESEEEAAKLQEEARKKQVDIQAKAGLVPEPTPSAAELREKKAGSSK